MSVSVKDTWTYVLSKYLFTSRNYGLQCITYLHSHQTPTNNVLLIHECSIHTFSLFWACFKWHHCIPHPWKCRISNQNQVPKWFRTQVVSSGGHFEKIAAIVAVGEIWDGPIAKKIFLGHPLTVCQILCFYRQSHDSPKFIHLSAGLVVILKGVLSRIRTISVFF